MKRNVHRTIGKRRACEADPEWYRRNRKYAKGKYLGINFITVEWDRERRTFEAMIMFHRTRDRQDNKPLGVVLHANNAETLVKMLQEYNLLYPVREETVIGIPRSGEEIRCISHSGCAYAFVLDLRKLTDCPP